MTTPETLKPAKHRQTGYQGAPLLDPPVVLDIPEATTDLTKAREDLAIYGLCLVSDILTEAEVEALGQRLDKQAQAERALADKAPPGALAVQQSISNMVNKGALFLDLVERPIVDELAGFLLGKDFLISSLTAGVFHGPTSEPQQLHRDQGQVPATADFPAACNVFWLLDDFKPERGSTYVVPGSHRWPSAYQIEPPPRSLARQIKAKAGTLFVFDGRIWHGYGANKEGHPRRHLANFLCLPWMRQQENWGVTCLQEVLEEASPKLKRRLGLRTYGTLGMMNGTKTELAQRSLGNYDVMVPEYIIGELGQLHKTKRVSRDPS
jgi:hypothetical protein